jgi:DNA transformation protein and related proteins
MTRIRNLGPVSRSWLAAIEVHSIEDLREIGAVDAYRVLALRGYRVSLNLLWAMEAALRDLHWMELDQATRDRIKAQLAEPWDPARRLGF